MGHPAFVMSREIATTKTQTEEIKVVLKLRGKRDSRFVRIQPVLKAK